VQISKRSFKRSFSYANITATLALVFAMSGGALAANHYLISSTKQISPKILKKLRGAAGKTGATGATGATGPTGPAGKDGVAGKEGVSGMLRWRQTVPTAGANEAEATSVVLATAGPFTVTGRCWEEEEASKHIMYTYSATFLSTSEAGSFAEAYDQGIETPLKANSSHQVSDATAEGQTATHEASFESADDGSWGAATADGSLTLNGFGSEGVWLQGASGPACSFSGYLVTE